MTLRGAGREAALMELAQRVKVTIVGEDYNMQQLIKSVMASKAAPTVHAVIAEEVIRQGISRQEYRKVLVPLFERIRDSIGWVDTPGARFCPKWHVMKEVVEIERKKARGGNRP